MTVYIRLLPGVKVHLGKARREVVAGAEDRRGPYRRGRSGREHRGRAVVRL